MKEIEHMFHRKLLGLFNVKSSTHTPSQDACTFIWITAHCAVTVIISKNKHVLKLKNHFQKTKDSAVSHIIIKRNIIIYMFSIRYKKVQSKEGFLF